METGTITGRFSASSLLSEDDLIRLRMGRLIRHEEIEGRQLIHFSDGARLLQHLLGLGVDWTRPALRSTRPRTADGRQSFVFSHRTVSKRRWLTAGQTLPSKPILRGVGPGTAKKFSAYIRRAEAVEQHEGRATVAGSAEAFRPEFWDAVEARERADGRIQSRIVAELPYEGDVGPEGRRRILQRLGEEFDDLGLPWMGVVHQPDAHSDRRNYHLHLIYHDRSAVEAPDGDLLLARKKCPDCRDRGFIPHLRKRYAALVNDEFQRAGLDRRWDPRRYDQMGLAKEPGEHLGVKATALERKGVATLVGSRNVAREFAYRIRLAEQDAATIASETLKALERTKIVGKYISHGDVPRELMNAAEAFIEAAIIYADWRSLEASRLIKLSLAQWLHHAMPSRLTQVARTGEVESEAAGETADDLLWHLDNRIGILTDALDRVRLNARQARDRLTQAERRFEDEVLLHRLGRCRETIVRLRQRQTTSGGKATEQQWADGRKRWQQQQSAAQNELRSLHRELADDILPHLFGGALLASLQNISAMPEGVEKLRDILQTWHMEDPGSARTIRTARDRLNRMDRARWDASLCQDKLDWMDKVDADPRQKKQLVVAPAAQTASSHALEVESERLEALAAKVRRRPYLWRIAQKRGLAGPLDEGYLAVEVESARHDDVRPVADRSDGRAGRQMRGSPYLLKQQPQPFDQPAAELKTEVQRPADQPTTSLKLGTDDDGTSVLAGKSDQQLLAIRKATVEELAAHRGKSDAWSVAQKILLRHGLRVLNKYLAELGIKTQTQSRKLPRRNRGFEL